MSHDFLSDLCDLSGEILLTMKFHTRVAKCADLARPSLGPRPRCRCNSFDFEDEDDDEDEDDLSTPRMAALGGRPCKVESLMIEFKKETISFDRFYTG